MKRTFICNDEISNKFWTIEIQGNTFIVNYGKTGTAGQTQTKEFTSEAECQKQAEKLIAEKTKKGYIEEAVRKYNFKNLQWIPATIKAKNEEKIGGFYVVNILQRLESFDKEKSLYEIDKHADSWRSIDKIVLDKKKLSKIPLDDRLVYVSKEHCGHILFHKKIVDAILSVNPNNIKAIPVEEWGTGAQFSL